MAASASPRTALSTTSDAMTEAADAALAACVSEIRACRICRDHPRGAALPHEPRPVVRVSTTARIAVCGQAPGTRVHASGLPFTDPSGVRLRGWMGVTEAEFYDERRVAVIPMGFCFPGLDATGGDLAPRRECAETWHEKLFAQLPQLDLLLLVGGYAQRWHLPRYATQSLAITVADWRDIVGAGHSRTHAKITILPLPHPSWRNNGWLKARPWFESDLLPELRAMVRERL